MKGYLALDTNIILVDAKSIYNLGADNALIIPETVLDEVDSKKSGFTEVAFQAREFGRIITKFQQMGTFTLGNCIVTSLVDNDITINIISLVKYPAFEAVDNHILNDRRIIQAVLDYQRDAKVSVKFMSNDVMCRIRATSFGLEAIDLKTVDAITAEFTKSITVSTDIFPHLHNMSIFEVDPSYTQANYNYLFTDDTTGQVKLATLRNGAIDIIGKDSEAELRRQDAPPMNAGQLFLSRAIQSPSTDLVVVESRAGSGKTVTAISNAVQLVKKGLYNGIIYLRASVNDEDKVEQVGFLSGNDDKIAVYLHPLEDTIDFLVRSNHKDSKFKGAEYENMIAEAITKYKTRYNIKGMIGLGLRGRTFSDTVIIIDEVQNFSPNSLVKALTRVGKNCKVILIGSNRQIDNPYITKYTNGLSVILDACTKANPLVRTHVVPLTKVLRSPLTEWTENIFSKH